MVLKNAIAAALCTGLLMSGSAALADEYKAGELIGLDLSKALLSPKRVERPTRVVHQRAEKPRGAARVKLARRHTNPLDAQARDTRIQTWPCKSGAICGWQN
jgi:hypothetical protein